MAGGGKGGVEVMSGGEPTSENSGEQISPASHTMRSFCIIAFDHIMSADFEVADTMICICNAGGNNRL